LTATRASADSQEGINARKEAIKIAKNKGINPIIEASLPKMMSPKTYTQNPELVMEVHKIMQNTSLDGIVGDLMGMINRPDSTSMLTEIHVPTLIIHGNDDQIIPLEEVETMHNAIPKSKLVILPDAGHLLNLEQPELFNNTLRIFLQ
jgi:pimeloyl-ACP methyl ester carboxylesterase